MDPIGSRSSQEIPTVGPNGPREDDTGPRPEAAKKKTDIDSQRSSGLSPKPSSPGARNWKSTGISAPGINGLTQGKSYMKP